jgi:hypothetical protein
MPIHDRANSSHIQPPCCDAPRAGHPELLAEVLPLDLDVESPGPEQHRLAKAVGELGTTSGPTQGPSPNYGERYRADEPISSSFVDAAVNQVVSKRMAKK